MWLASLVEAQETHAQVLKQSIWKQVHTTEQACKIAQAVKVTLVEGHQSSSLAMVIDPSSDSSAHQTFVHKSKLDMVCLAEAGRHFMQAYSTPCLTDPLLHLFGAMGQSPPTLSRS